MNLNASKEHTAMTVDIDELLQDTYLLVVELRQGAGVRSNAELTRLCMEQVEQVRQRLALAGLKQRSIDHIIHAQCALLDETVLSCATDEAHATWASQPLQARIFNRHQAGEFLYEDMREVMREPAPDLHVLTVFQRVLTLGFRGRYGELSDPEREQLLLAVNSQVVPLNASQSLVTQVAGGNWRASLAWLRSPQVHVLAVVLVLASTWWGLDYLLSDALDPLLAGQR
ncbi:type VI secretion system protein TssL, short form [Pseudomonas sp. 18175]|uniref:type VI secretion system protein TssL, short form n=1 Tax=Pseudomonas sp. 18175 TaxID=3390056 RepID=UPI003D1E0883